MKKILSVVLGLALCCMLAALPACAEESAAQAVGEGYATLVSGADQLIPVYVDESAEGAIGSLSEAIAASSLSRCC